MINLKTYVAPIFMVVHAVLPVISFAQQQPKVQNVAVVNGQADVNLIVKDENGKVLQQQEFRALMNTGDYKVQRALSKDNKPYLQVIKAPGFARRPQSAPVVVKPKR